MLGIVCGCMLYVPGKLFAAGLEPAWLVQSDGMHGPINVETAASGSMVQILGSPGLASSSKPADYDCQALREEVSTE